MPFMPFPVSPCDPGTFYVLAAPPPGVLAAWTLDGVKRAKFQLAQCAAGPFEQALGIR
jgi:hypothetical protein